jgi:hypothetical protein
MGKKSDASPRRLKDTFHQGVDLPTFNLLEAFLKASLRELYRSGLLDKRGPQNLEDWERQVRMSILMYGAYSQAYRVPSGARILLANSKTNAISI